MIGVGMDQRITFGPGKLPAWPAIRETLAGLGYRVQMRMIDGQLAFPDEVPPTDWHELRLGTPQGIISLRREGNDLVCVVWANADPGLTQAWNALAWACAQCGDGRVQTPQGPCDAGQFRKRIELPPGLGG
jgi:hypothetical protein